MKSDLRINTSRLDLTVFITGAAVMALELTGSRLIAPYLGTSIHVWTSLIGVILGALSLGYYYGGKLADKNPSAKVLALILFVSAAMTALIVPLHYPIMGYLSTHLFDRRLAATVVTTLFFAGPAIALGTVLPFTVRLKLSEIDCAGTTVGRLYALSTLGSILGTFSVGFFLLSLLGTTAIILLIALCLSLLAIVVCPTHVVLAKLGLSALIILLIFADRRVRISFAEDGLVDLDTAYQRVFVLTETSKATPRQTRKLITDILGTQSAIYLDNPEELVGEYAKYYDLAFLLNPEIRRVLVLGGGAYSVPKHLLRSYTQVKVDVVELDPGITEVAKDYFGLENNDRLTIYHEDARTFLNATKNSYDAIFVDVFQASPNIPFQLTTVEAITEMRRLLTEDGIVIMNIIGAIDGDAGRFLRAEVHSYRQLFPAVYLFPVTYPENPAHTQNIILVASPKEIYFESSGKSSPFDYLLQHRWLQDILLDMPILTDDYAPVESYMLPLYRKWQEELELAKVKG